MKHRRHRPDAFITPFRHHMAAPYLLEQEGFEYNNPNVKAVSVYQPDFAVDTVDTLLTGEQSLIRTLQSKQPRYGEYVGQWADWYNWYAGRFIDQYIWRHHRERPEKYAIRRQRGYY